MCRNTQSLLQHTLNVKIKYIPDKSITLTPVSHTLARPYKSGKEVLLLASKMQGSGCPHKNDFHSWSA